MFLAVAAAPFKIVYDTIEGTMSNAGGSSYRNSMPPMMPRAPMNAPQNAYATQPKQMKQSPKIQPASFVSYQVSNLHLGSDPILITCPCCFAMVTTKVIYEVGDNPPACSFLLCCSNSTKDALHYCPSCHAFLGKFSP